MSSREGQKEGDNMRYLLESWGAVFASILMVMAGLALGLGIVFLSAVIGGAVLFGIWCWLVLPVFPTVIALTYWQCVAIVAVLRFITGGFRSVNVNKN